MVHFHVHKSHPVVPVPNQLNPVHTPLPISIRNFSVRSNGPRDNRTKERRAALLKVSSRSSRAAVLVVHLSEQALYRGSVSLRLQVKGLSYNGGCWERMRTLMTSQKERNAGSKVERAPILSCFYCGVTWLTGDCSAVLWRDDLTNVKPDNRILSGICHSEYWLRYGVGARDIGVRFLIATDIFIFPKGYRPSLEAQPVSCHMFSGLFPRE